MYLTYGVPLKPQHAYYDLTTFVLHTNPFSLYDTYSLTLREKTNQEQATYIGETGRNLTTRLTEHKRATKRVTSTITLLNTT